MKIRTVTSLREFDDLARVWRDVTETSGQHSVLLTHDWFACCWRTAGPNRARELWVVEDTTGPIALIPLIRARSWYRGFPARVLQLMHPPESPVVDFPVTRDVDNVMRLVLARLERHDDWDVFLLPGLSAHSPIWKAFGSATGGRFDWRIADRVNLPLVAVSERDPLLRGALASLHRIVNSAPEKSRDTVTIEEHTELDPRGALFDEIMGVVRNGHRSMASLPAPTAEEVRRFFRELTARASANGWLRLWVLRLAGRVVETEYQLAAHGTVHALRRDADQSPPALRLRELLTLTILETLVSRGHVHSYIPTPAGNDNGLLHSPTTYESMFVEMFASGTYGLLLHRFGTRLASVAQRLGFARGESCA